MVIYTVILFYRIGWIGVVMPIFLILIYFQNKFINKITVIKTKEKNIQGDKRGKKINECIEGIKIVKFSAWELIFLDSIDSIRREEVDKNYQLFFFRSLNDAALILFPSILAFVSLWLYSLTHPEPLDLGNTFVVITSFNLILQPTRQFFNSINNILTAVVSFKRIELLRKLRKFQNSIGLDAIAPGEIHLENYTAEFDDEQVNLLFKSLDPKISTSPTLALKNISISISAKQFVGLYGPVGTGKTTLLKAMIG